jgi:glucans biosynthesis protein C
MSRAIESMRYHALDRVRATAMLLGVVYHTLLFRMFVERSPPPMGGFGAGGGARYLQEWLHSFRMPLFFIISGFFGRMMLEKHGASRYFARRWYRIGIPLVIGMFTVVPVWSLSRDALLSMLGTGGSPRSGALTANSDLDRNPAGRPSPGGPSGRQFGGRPMPPGPFGPPADGFSERLFGARARFFHLNHLWFLWYLLVFATVAPPLMKVVAIVVQRISGSSADRLGVRVLQLGLAPLALGAIAAPALMLTGGTFGWSLGMPESIFRAFPDFLLHFDRTMPGYFVFYVAGWWLHRTREALPSIAERWLSFLVAGTLAFVVSTRLSDTYVRRPDVAHYALLRWGGYTLYCIASAATGFAFLGFFLKYLDKPSATWRYLADTALWVYLVHPPLVIVGLYWVAPYHLPWWALAVVVALFASAASLVLYEAIVRRTFLVHLFGPASARRSPRREVPVHDPAMHLVGSSH